MRKYELFCFIKPTLDMDEVDQVIKNIEETIEKLGGKIQNTDKQGRKRLAYIIDGFKDGFQVTINMELPEEKMDEFDRFLNLNENVVRNLVTLQKKAKVTTCK